MKSIGQTLYQLTTQRGPQPAEARSSRPAGRLVWLHISDDTRTAAMATLADQLKNDHDMQVLVTGAKTAHLNDAAPSDHPADIALFLSHWMPDVIVLTGGEMRPSLMFATQERALPVILVDGVSPYLVNGAGWLWRGLIKDAARAFHAIVTVDELSARAYRKLGAVTVQRFGRIESDANALPYFESERAALATLFATRPTWLACDVPQIEEAAVIAAHRAALRLAHRLLLILVPRDPARAPALAEAMELNEGWLVARRELNEEPDPEIAVYIAETPEEYGLWYRLAPVTFMGGSVLGAGSSRSPMEAAALGSAIIHGRRTGDFGSEYGRLGAALGAAVASNPAEVADLLSELLAPDRAARLAHAAWGVASEGAEVTARIVAIILHSIGEAR